MYEIQRMTARQRHERQTRTYQVLIDIAEEVVGNARAGLERTRTMRGKDMFTDMAIEELRGQIEHFCGLGDRVIDQARRRVLFGEQVATDEKIYSIFEPHTDLIKRGKVRTPVEFGHKVFFAESAEGLITQFEVLKGNPPDEVHVASSLQRHRQAFGRAPELYGSDRGFFSEQNLASCKHAGVKLVCIPQRGGKRTPRRQAYESSAAFKNGQRFRAGIEGRISVLFRGRGMKRCLAEGSDRFELWVGAAVLANNLMKNRGTTDGSVASQTNSCLTDTQARFPADQNGRGSTCLELKVCHAIPSPSSKITRQCLSIGVRSGPQIGIQGGPPRFAFRTISVRPVGAGRGCGDGASAG